MIIAITGGAGFIGGRLAQLLRGQGHDVRILDVTGNDPVDVRNKDAVIKALQGVDVVYHLAAEHRDDVSPLSLYYDVNVGGAENIVAAAKQNGLSKIIFTSSVAVYGLDVGESKETDVPQPFNDYGRSKLQSEEVFEKWAASDQKNTLVTMRLVATFGPGNRGNIYTLMEQIAGGKFIMVGDGSNKKSIAYVENVAACLAYCLNFKPGLHLYNYADKPDISMKEMVADINAALGTQKSLPPLPYALGLAGGKIFDVAAKVTGKKFPISEVRVRKFCANTIVNADKIFSTGFKAPHRLQDGLKSMIAAEFQKRDAA